MATASRSRYAVLGSTLGLAALALVVTACGGGSKPSSGISPAAGSSSAPNRQNFTADFGVVSGMVQAVSNGTAAVKESNGTKGYIAWASVTRFSRINTIALSGIAKGDCVSVSGVGTATSSSAPTKSITAATVSLTGTKGCAFRSGSGGFPGGSVPGGGNGSPPPFSNLATPRPSGSPGFRGGFGGGRRFNGAFGTVSSISGSTLVVKSPIGASSVTVTTTAKTTFTSTTQASASDVTSGVCVDAIGAKTSTGRINARQITLSSPVNGKCVTRALGGLGGRGFGFGFGAPPTPISSPGVANA
ncbi:MAG TPA: DUF5666 domain-containing protein [Mycobacteriales bacterium]|nr:DUF5666 domain-containing protein [Mycobacteriales bacterium]